MNFYRLWLLKNIKPVLLAGGISHGDIRDVFTAWNCSPVPDACLLIVYVPVHIVMGIGHAHDCRHAHARGYYHGHKKYIIGIAHGYSHEHAHFILAVPMALSTGTPDPTLLKASF